MRTDKKKEAAEEGKEEEEEEKEERKDKAEKHVATDRRSVPDKHGQTTNKEAFNGLVEILFTLISRHIIEKKIFAIHQFTS
jgi:hypothetical protein